jgi:hypothetical protein
MPGKEKSVIITTSISGKRWGYSTGVVKRILLEEGSTSIDNR